ncbi:MAG: hypothetical protein P4L57_00500 [Rhizomicrobium sp.]|nr:hypothetical protein [Rhizomicrobium sp.]
MTKTTGSLWPAATRVCVARRRIPAWITWLAVFAFALQSFVAQTHIHLQTIDQAAATTPLTPGHSKSPADDGSAACPLCQAVANAGAYFAPTTPLLLPPVLQSNAVALPLLAALLGVGTTHSWRSRAPPQL